MSEKINNLDFLIQLFLNINDYYYLITILPILIFGLVYFFGKLRISNEWEYVSNKQISTLQGVIFLNKYVFIPLVTLIFLFFYYYWFSFFQNLLVIKLYIKEV